jgi:DNA-directed RNA polymerase subunit RPC12/RpoP
MIFCRTLLDEIQKIDRVLCGDCSLRGALGKAANRNDRDFLICGNCGRHWMPDADLDQAARGWVLVFTTTDAFPVALMCLDCAAEHPDPMSLPAIVGAVLGEFRGPVQ